MCEHTFAAAIAWWLEVDSSVPCSRRDQAVPLQGAQHAGFCKPDGRGLNDHKGGNAILGVQLVLIFLPRDVTRSA